MAQDTLPLRHPRHLLTFLHECAHLILGHLETDNPVMEEYEAERWAIDTMRREGIKVPREELMEAKRSVAFLLKPGQEVPYRVRRWLGL
jgi:hypothetical protein